jgi:hypothetical protein
MIDISEGSISGAQVIVCGKKTSRTMGGKHAIERAAM